MLFEDSVSDQVFIRRMRLAHILEDEPRSRGRVIPEPYRTRYSGMYARERILPGSKSGLERILRYLVKEPAVAVSIK